VVGSQSGSKDLAVRLHRRVSDMAMHLYAFYTHVFRRARYGSYSTVSETGILMLYSKRNNCL